jgi:predicted GNAT family acetyltransferase
MIKKNIFYCLCIFLLLISKMAFAKEQTDTLESKVIYTDFVMTKFIAQVNRTIESKGNAKISEENGICWKVTSPISKVLHITSNGVIDLTDENALQNKNTLFFVAFYNENPVGMSYAHVTDDVCRVDYLLVSPEYRKIGIGRTLINAFVKYCKENKISLCYLWPDGKSAEQIYHKAGFRHFSTKFAGRAKHI